MNPAPRLAASFLVGIAAAIALMPACRGSSSGLLLVANKADASLSIVDPDDGRQLAVVAEGATTGHEVAVSPDGLRAFVPIYSNVGVGSVGTDGQLMRVVDLRKRAVVATLDFGRGVRPHRPVFEPVRGLLYVTTELENSVTVVDPESLAIVGSIPTGEPQTHMLAITRDGRRGYTANVSTGTVSVLDLDHRKLVTVIQAAPRTQRIALSADDHWAFTADQTALRLVVIDTSTNTVSRSIPLPGLGFGTAATPDGRWLLAAIPALDVVAVVDMATLRVVRTIAVPKAPQEVLVRPDGAVAYVSCDAAAKVAAVDLRSFSVQRLIDVGRSDDGLAWAPYR
jgi:DNA-binding beta-propeller fold protein YncE